MATWSEFAKAAPEMAALGLKQFEKFHIAYLATVRKDGSPRVHPVSPIFAGGRLFVATAPTSPKRLDQIRDGRYVIHALPGKEEEEFLIRGRARRVTDDATRAAVAEAAGHTVRPEDWVFEYDIETAATTYWENVGQPDTRPIRRRWSQL
ncbi:MAG: pyridoxamine 5'-phosphate oxidase family protein [Chloroflexi bacterium]|nr:pyridoxamine 5'-phosphate oxidase family protein [Chloroflexota bacterium]